ncbi:unnamed protein product [Moneuplotes crassus]|uniref:Pirin n=1 Tax=Euplotes crassus TaxID=5936 RepID=A0AAD1XLL2_EUPCR|nr:unnamed protein product [Moneuplotes crassus]
MQSFVNRKDIKKHWKPKFQNDGVGARGRRIIGSRDMSTKEMDPFLMLDLFSIKLPAGFPDHPHRGFETVTYMISGKIYHEDFKGHKGTIGPGDVQWMTAGKGIVHAEIPASKIEASVGFQLWVNLKKEDKMKEPAYQEYPKEEIPYVDKWDSEGIRARVIAGKVFDVKGSIYTRTPVELIDFELDKDAIYQHTVAEKWNVLVFCFEGSFEIFQENGEPKKLKTYMAAVLHASDDEEVLEIKGLEEGSRFMLIAGLPLKEPIASYGPFVMNTDDEISDTISDYQDSDNGFEGADTWESDIKDLMTE